MTEAILETICINGTRPPYKGPAWVIGQVGSKEMNRRAQTATARERKGRPWTENRTRPKSTPSRLNVTFDDSPSARCARWRQVQSAQHRNSLEEPFNDDGMTITLAPGYLLSRSKEKINVTITDEFFFKDGTKEKNKKKITASQ